MKNWDWQIGKKEINTNVWKSKFEWVEEPYVSLDGEKIASIVKLKDGKYDICINGQKWGKPFEKIWNLRFSPDGRLTALVSEEEEWTVCIDGKMWEKKFSFVWNTIFDEMGKNIAVAVQQDMKYGMACNGILWKNTYFNITNMAIGPDGKKTAGVVQVTDIGQGEIFKFQSGIFTVAVNGETWNRNFVNLWSLAFSPNGCKVAAEARTSLYDYTIVVNGEPWPKTYQCVWQPIFNAVTQSVLAPVHINGKWMLAENGEIIWNSQFDQLWQQKTCPNGNHIAAVVSPRFGRWTVAKNEKPWKMTFSDIVTNVVFSSDGNRLAAIVKNKGKWTIVVDGIPWKNMFDMVWEPVFSSDNQFIAAKIEKNKKFSIAVNDCILPFDCESAWNPVFSPEGDKLLIRTIENGNYYRRILPLAELMNQ